MQELTQIIQQHLIDRMLMYQYILCVSYCHDVVPNRFMSLYNQQHEYLQRIWLGIYYQNLLLFTVPHTNHYQEGKGAS